MEMERFREGETTDGYTGFYMPNGNHYGVKKISRERSCKKYLSYILNVVLLLILLIIILTYAFYPKCEYVANDVLAASNGGAHFTYTLSSDDSVTNGKYLTTQSDQDPNITLQDSGQNDGNEVNSTTETVVNPDKSNEGDLTYEEFSSEDYKLPGFLHPVAYRIVLIPHFITNMTTSGNISIEMKCTIETNVVTLNAKKIIIDEKSVSITSIEDLATIEIDSIYLDEKSEMLKIMLKKTLEISKIYIVSMSFHSFIQNSPKGLYRTQYALNGKMGLMVNTMFSPTEARSVFPCFDEPIYKAKFTFVIGRLPSFRTLSNMNLELSVEEYFDTMYYMDVYHQTPPMSTYLTAFAITEFEAVHSSVMHSNITFAGHSESNELFQMQLILRWMEKLTIFFGKYFNISYPLGKMDLIAVPDQLFIAMENWGLITFKKNLAYMNEGTTEEDKQRTVFILAHEIAHQWFGNLVTPKWWDNLWLKEGFSTYFGCLAINEEQTDWKINDHFQIDILENAFSVDTYRTSVPLSKSVSKTSSEMFSTIAYDKGASIIRMMSHFMGPNNLKKGVTSYLNTFAYNNADQDDLWNVLKEYVDASYTGNIDLKRVMESWTLRAGYPVVQVNRQENYLYFQQQRLLLSEMVQNESNWWIPITYVTQSDMNFTDTQPKLWLVNSTVHEEKFKNRNDWIIVNPAQVGYYRVNYDETNWLKLIEAFDTLPSNIKAQLISDSLFLAQASVLRYDIALSLTLKMSNEIDYMPWRAVSNNINYIGNLVRNMPAYGNFRLLIVNLMRKVYNPFSNTAIWMENEFDPIKQLHIVNILNMACYFDHAECVKSSYDLYNEKMANPVNPIPNFIRHIVYCSAVRYGGQRTWVYTYKTLKATNATEERRRLLHSLGCSKEQWLLTKALSMLLPNSEIKLNTEETLILFESVMANSLGNQIGVNFIRDQWPSLLSRYDSPSMLYKMVSYILYFINSPYYVSELKVLVDDIEKTTKEKSLILQQTVEAAENNIVWMNKNYFIVSSFLDLFVKEYQLE